MRRYRQQPSSFANHRLDMICQVCCCMHFSSCACSASSSDQRLRAQGGAVAGPLVLCHCAAGCHFDTLAHLACPCSCSCPHVRGRWVGRHCRAQHQRAQLAAQSSQDVGRQHRDVYWYASSPAEAVSYWQYPCVNAANCIQHLHLCAF